MRSERASAAGEGWSGVESGGGERTARNVTSPCSFDAVAPSMSQSVPQLQVLDAFENSFWLASCLPLDVVWAPNEMTTFPWKITNIHFSMEN